MDITPTQFRQLTLFCPFRHNLPQKLEPGTPTFIIYHFVWFWWILVKSVSGSRVYIAPPHTPSLHTLFPSNRLPLFLPSEPPPDTSLTNATTHPL